MLKYTVPFVDLRDKTQVDLLRRYPDKALSLFQSAKAGKGFWGRFGKRPFQGISDRAARHWLHKNNMPYANEINNFSEMLHVSGVQALNTYCDWTATSGVYRSDESVSMLYSFNSSVPSMGKNLMVVLQKSKEGEFYNITWPGISGVYAAMAPERFSVSVNRGPVRKYSSLLFKPSIKAQFCSQDAYMPQHLLRQVMEHAPDYESAKYMLSHVPVASPCLFTLSGVKAGQGCVIERLEHNFYVRELSARNRVCAADHFTSTLYDEGRGWVEDVSESSLRVKQLASIQRRQCQSEQLDWLTVPVINPHTRFCMIADAATKRLTVQAYEGLLPEGDSFNLPMSDISRLVLPTYNENHYECEAV